MNLKWFLVLVGSTVLLLALASCGSAGTPSVNPAVTPTCSPANLQAPILTSPAIGAVESSLSPSLSWSYPAACLLAGYRVDLSTDSAFTGINLGGMTGNPSSQWAPGSPLADCTTYFWKISPVSGTTIGPSSEVSRFSTDVTGTCSSPTSTASPTSAASPTPEIPTSAPAPAQLTFTTDINAYCLLGPDRVFKVLEIAMMDIPYVMEGRDKDNRWYKITLSDRVSCWVSMFSGKASGDPSTLPVLPEVPFPTPTPVFCTAQKTPSVCESFSFCKWYWSGTISSGYCDGR